MISTTFAKLRSRYVNMPVNFKSGCAGMEGVMTKIMEIMKAFMIIVKNSS